MELTTQSTQTDLFVRMALESWNSGVKRFNQFLESVNAGQMERGIAPGRNTGIYLIGHLTAVADGMLSLLGLQDKLYPELAKPFLEDADKSGNVYPSFDALKVYWEKVTETLDQHFRSMDTHSWMDRHTAVSPGDFENEPHRNKLNVLLSRTNHQSYHFGQIILLQSKP